MKLAYLIPIGLGVGFGLWLLLRKKPISVEEWAVSHEHRIELAKERGIYWETGAGGYIGGYGWHHRKSDTWMPRDAYWDRSGTWQTEVDWINQF